MIERDIRRIRSLDSEIKVLNIGATAVGTAINVNPVYLFHIIRNVNLVCGTDCSQAEDLFDATQNLDGFVHTSAALRVCAVNLSKICNDLRLLSSGPKAGLGEINLPPEAERLFHYAGKDQSGYPGGGFPGCLQCDRK